MAEVSSTLLDASGSESKMTEWKLRLYQAEGLDQIKAAITGWRDDESTPGPSRNIDLQSFLDTPICRGDIPSIVYLLEEEQLRATCVAGKYALSDERVPEDKRLQILDILYCHGWDLNIRFGSHRYTVMSQCVHKEASVRWLLDHGAHPHAGAPADCVPISHAARDGSLETIELLLERGANPKDGIPLKYAIVRKKEDWKAVIELLLDYGCDINEARRSGISRRGGRPQSDPGTVLHTAALWNCHERIPFLLEKGADPLKLTIGEKAQLTPAQYALKNDSEEAAAVLAEAERWHVKLGDVLRKGSIRDEH